MYEMNIKNIPWLRFEELPSTNDFAKQRQAEGRALFITAKVQSGGRGTKGRSFSSNEGGVYLSLLRFYDDFPAKDAFSIMCASAVAVCETLEGYGLSPRIKWPNDIHVNGKKICGILIENTFQGSRIRASIVGIGLNVQNALPKELEKIATSVLSESGKRLSTDEVAVELAERLLAPCNLEKYERYLGYVGEEVLLLTGEERIAATLIGVNGDGKLRARVNGEERLFSSAEVRLQI